MMFNSQAPSSEDLPTSKQLIRSTLIAIFVAIVVLVGAVLPAEYGVDPTGVGSLLGLKAMGEIKVNLEQEEIAHSPSVLQNGINTQTTVPTPMPLVARPEMEMVDKKPIKTDVVEHTLSPGEAIEFKLEMKQDAVAQYKWTTTNGKLNHDTHGDGYRGTKQFISYKKGRMITSDQGEIKAAFDGYHGWFWRNRDDKPVSFRLETSGDYIALKKMM
jgi:hypothetical protein